MLNEGLDSIDILSSVWKFDLFDEVKQEFFQSVAVSVLLYGWTKMDFNEMEKKLDGNYRRILRAFLNKFQKQHPI